jgi:hypothetical protein
VSGELYFFATNEVGKMRKQKKSILVLGIITISLATTLFLLSRILPASERFEMVLDGKAVLDKQTGLIWEQSPDTTTRSWAGAIAYCDNKTTGGRKGWRLPTVKKLASLVNPSHTVPALPSGHPFSNVQSTIYWSLSTSGSDSSNPGIVFFHCGYVSAFDKSHHYVWCVQAGE